MSIEGIKIMTSTSRSTDQVERNKCMREHGADTQSTQGPTRLRQIQERFLYYPAWPPAQNQTLFPLSSGYILLVPVLGTFCTIFVLCLVICVLFP